MTDLDHRVGVREANLVVRHLKLEGVTDDNKQPMLDDIDHKFGVDSVNFDDKTATLNVAYDAVNCCIDGIEEIIKAHGADVSHDWWTRFKEGYYQFTDQNIKDNSQHEPWSCHKSPPGAGKK